MRRYTDPMRKRLEKYLSLSAIVTMTGTLMLTPFVPVQASVFNPHYIISDAEMRDASTMSYFEIYSFLQEKGRLNSVFVESPDLCTKNKPEGYDPHRDSIPMVKGVAQMIYDAANCYGVNPKYILAVIEKEMSVVTWDPARSHRLDWQDRLDWAAGYALCDGCKKTSTLAQKYKGIDRQIDVVAGWMDWYYENYANYPSFTKPGETKIISGTRVTPVNIATAALYTYTPHVGNSRYGGNRLFWSIWKRWFGEGITMSYPDGTLLRDEKTGAVVVMQNSKARLILSESVLLSRYNASTVIDINTFDFTSLVEANPGKPINFPDIALVRIEDGTTYLLVGDTMRRIVSDEVSAKIGFNPEEIEDIKAVDLDGYILGIPVTLEEAFPTGQLVQDTSTGGVFFAEAGVKHPLWDRALLEARFPGQQVLLAMTPEELATLPTGSPVMFRDGTLVKSPDDPTVYVIAGGKKMPIPSETVFLAYGYKWTNIITTSVKALSLHPTTEPLLLIVDPLVGTATEI